MDEEAIDELIDEATHAVNNLIPDAVLNRMTGDERSDLLVQINDALSPILRELLAEADDFTDEFPDDDLRDRRQGDPE